MVVSPLIYIHSMFIKNGSRFECGFREFRSKRRALIYAHKRMIRRFHCRISCMHIIIENSFARIAISCAPSLENGSYIIKDAQSIT
jgi:hypothetical protein